MLIPISIAIILILVLYVFYGNTYIYTKSTLDGKYYKTKNNRLSQQSADILASINMNIVKLITHIIYRHFIYGI